MAGQSHLAALAFLKVALVPKVEEVMNVRTVTLPYLFYEAKGLHILWTFAMSEVAASPLALQGSNCF